MTSSNEFPDVIALPLELALEKLKESGTSVEVKKTYPVKPTKGTGEWRVVRQTAENAKLLLVASETSEGIVP